MSAASFVTSYPLARAQNRSSHAADSPASAYPPGMMGLAAPSNLMPWGKRKATTSPVKRPIPAPGQRVRAEIKPCPACQSIVGPEWGRSSSAQIDGQLYIPPGQEPELMGLQMGLAGISLSRPSCRVSLGELRDPTRLSLQRGCTSRMPSCGNGFNKMLWEGSAAEMVLLPG